MADNETPDRKDVDTRRVYTLPAELLARLRAYQVSQNIPSEVEAARRLLDTALQLRDTIGDILKRLSDRYNEEKDFRILASEILIKHYLVESINVNEGGLAFYFKNGEGGHIDQAGILREGSREYEISNWSRYKVPVAARPKPASAGGGWDNGGGDLDDEIPF